MTIESFLSQKILQRKQQLRYRSRAVLDSAQQVRITIEGEQRLSFCSNDYLGLANDEDVKAALQKATQKYGVGSGASHLVNGHSREHHALEQELAEFTGRERALLFSTGYMANLGVISALLGRKDTVFEDRLNHASLIDGGLLASCRFSRYKSCDMAHLASRLHSAQDGNKLIATDGVFSMDGNVAPLIELSELASQYNAWLMVDDAHGFGCIGLNGKGSVALNSLTQSQVPILVGTLGKAFGTFGAFVAGSENLIEALIQFARPYIYTTALPPAIAAATRVSLAKLRDENWRRESLSERIMQFRTGCERLGLSLLPSFTPIQAIIVNSESEALAYSNGLKQKGFWVTAIRPPTVPAGTSRLRVTLSSAHSYEDVDGLLNALQELTDELPHDDT